MTDIMASIGLVQMGRYPDILARRKEIISRYNEVCDTLPVKYLNHYTNTSISSGHLYLVRVNGFDVEKRNVLITKMAECGVATNVHYKPLPMHTAYKKLGFDIKDYPNAYKQYENEITLPLHTCLTDEQAAYVIDTFSKLLK